jgi:hypothetical protein
MAAVVEVALSPPRLTGPSKAASLIQKTPMPLTPHAVDTRFRYALLFTNHRDMELV